VRGDGGVSVLARDSTIRLRGHLASPSFPEHQTPFFRPTYAFDRRMRRKCCALFLFVAVASDAARLLRHGASSEGRDVRGQKRRRRNMMRVISVTELSRLTRAQLFSLYTQMQAVLAGLSEGGSEYEFAIGTLNNIKIVLFRKTPSP
jgi:hypothetical protein